nr:hypothetical protein [Tanacetum cinerariifolium]
MPGDEIESLSGFEGDETDNDDTQSEHKEEFSKADEATTDNVANMLACIDKSSQSDPFVDALEERLLEMLFDTLKTILLDFLKDSVKKVLHKLDKRVNKTLKAQVPDLILKPLNKELNALNTLKQQDGQSLKEADQEEEPLVKFNHAFTIPSPTPLNSIMPQGIRPPINIDSIPFEQFSASLFSSSSSEFSLTPPPIVADKGKGIATKEDPMNQMTIEDVNAQMEEIKRLTTLKREKEEYEKRLKVLTPEELKAQTAGLAAYEAKRAKMLKNFFLRVVRSKGLVIRKPKSGIFFYNGKFDLVFPREKEFHLATTTQLIRIQSTIKRDTPKGKEMYKKMEFVIEARNDVVEARKTVKDNLDNLGQQMLSGEDSLSAKHQRAMKDSLGAKHHRAMKDSLSAKPHRATSNAGYVNKAKWWDKVLFDLKPELKYELVKVVNNWQNCSQKYGRDVSKNGCALNVVVLPPQDSRHVATASTKDTTSYHYK